MTGREEVWGILGGGFGLYGYLPAVAGRTRGSIHTLERYRETIRGRKDINDYGSRISFEKDAGALLDHCNAVIIAMRPADQERILAGMLDRQWTGKVVLEKPLACTPTSALALLDRLSGSAIDFRIGFTLGATGWAAQLAQYLAANQKKAISLDFCWRFLAHHHRNALETWKRYPAQGGGAMRFYAIHLIALFAEWGFDRPLSFQRSATKGGEEPECRFAVSDGVGRATVVCDTHWQGQPGFSIRATAEGAAPFEVELEDPFKEATPNPTDDRLDARVCYLLKILDSFNEGFNSGGAYYRKHVSLWGQLEERAELLAPDWLA